MQVEMPGIGGNLGECVICGQTFLFEILFCKTVATFRVKGMDRDDGTPAPLPAHHKCLDEATKLIKPDGDWHKLPEGPLRREFEKEALSRQLMVIE